MLKSIDPDYLNNDIICQLSEQLLKIGVLVIWALFIYCIAKTLCFGGLEIFTEKQKEKKD